MEAAFVQENNAPTKREPSGFDKVKKFILGQKGWLFVLPAVLLMCLFTFYPIVNSLVLAFKQNVNISGAHNGWGIQNFKDVIDSNIANNIDNACRRSSGNCLYIGTAKDTVKGTKKYVMYFAPAL